VHRSFILIVFVRSFAVLRIIEKGVWS
jgi:hypothetical protein